MTGQLFTHYFLTDGIKATAEWQASVDQPEAFAAFRACAEVGGKPRREPGCDDDGNISIRPNPYARKDSGSFYTSQERRHLRARLDALYFHLYGLSRDDAEYVLDTFPIVRREDEAACGTYRTRDMTLAYMNALAAGDVEVRVAV